MSAYKILLTKTDDGYLVTVPDFRCNTQGKDIAESMVMARDVIGLMGITLEDGGNTIPDPNTVDYIVKEGDMELYVDVDFVEYRRKMRKTLRTIGD